MFYKGRQQLALVLFKVSNLVDMDSCLQGAGGALVQAGADVPSQLSQHTSLCLPAHSCIPCGKQSLALHFPIAGPVVASGGNPSRIMLNGLSTS